MPTIDRNSSVPFYQQVYEQIARGIESGIYPAGKKLPSIRECARELGVSNTTIELAYQRLTEEGYVQARRGSGYTICEMASTPTALLDRFPVEYRKELEALVDDEADRTYSTTPAYDFAYDSVDPATFPFTAWARICREVFFSAGSDDACLYNDHQGLEALRKQIAYYMSREHGLNLLAEQVLIMPTTRDLIAEITRLFDLESTVVAMSNPGYDEVRRRLHEQGCQLKKIPVFPYPTWEEVEAAIDGANLVFTTPASQFPTNQTMPIEMRKALIAWASRNDAYIIDDEYSWEFQSGVTRIPSLSALDDKGRVITLGTFSNSFTPAVCLSYAILPPRLMLEWRRRHRRSHPQVPWQTQAAMTRFMSDDHWRAHIRKKRTAIARKRQLLFQALEEHMGDAVQVLNSTCSLFVLVQTNDGRNESELIEAAARSGVCVYPTSQYWHDAPPGDWRYVLVGYSGISADSIEPGIKALAKAWGIQGGVE